MENIKFEGIDSFNRPVFKSMQHKNRYGSTDKLFSTDATEVEVLARITEKDLCFFGRSFGCEPMGYTATNIKIIK